MADRYKAGSKEDRTVRETPQAAIDRILDDPEMDSFIEDLEKGLRIDKNSLDDELEQHPQVLYEVSRRLALQISRRDAAKHQLELEEARAHARIKGAAKEDDKRVTNLDIEAQKARDPEVVKVANDLMRLNYSVGRLSALKEAFMSRGYVLKDLVSLFEANYWTTASAGSAGAAVKQQQADRVRAEQARMRRG